MRNVREYAAITGTYWVFTLTDGALRMLVLLYLHELGYAPLKIASLFLSYEAFGVATNFAAGWIGARFGLRSTLFAGLTLQIASCAALAVLSGQLSVGLVLVTQALSGTAKDLTKMSSKSYIKLVVPEGDDRGLLKWVAVLTGSKNTLKGAGFFLGGLMLATIGFRGACVAMALGLGVALSIAAVVLPRAAGKATSKVRVADLFGNDPTVNWLSAARLFLFGARDIWFVLALPIFLSSELSWSHSRVGGFLALWVIGYGVVQALAPAYVGTASSEHGAAPPNARRLGLWTGSLLVPLFAIPAALAGEGPPGATITLGLVVFGVLFATTSAVHSFLIIAYADGDRVALSVGFYYMANAAGRLAGTLLSGALFQAAGQGQQGLIVCLVGSVVFVLASTGLCLPLRAAERRREDRLAAHAVAPGGG